MTVNHVTVNFDKNSIYIYNYDDGSLGVEVECYIDFSVDVEFENTSNAYYDSEDKQWYGTESDTAKIQKAASTYVDLKYDETYRFLRFPPNSSLSVQYGRPSTKTSCWCFLHSSHAGVVEEGGGRKWFCRYLEGL